MKETAAGLKAVREENRKKNNGKFLILALICCVYFIVPSGLVIVSAALFLLWIFDSIRKQNEERTRAFREQQKIFTEKFKEWVRKYISSSDRVRCACGYLEGTGEFRDVNIFLNGEQLYVTKLLFRKFFVYSINNEFWYLFDVEKDGNEKLLEADKGEIQPEICPENHQDFLRKKGMQWENLNIVEGYIYNRFMKQMLDGTLTGRIAMDDGIDSLRKEALYSVRMADGNMLYLTEPALDMLGLKE